MSRTALAILMRYLMSVDTDSVTPFAVSQEPLPADSQMAMPQPQPCPPGAMQVLYPADSSLQLFLVNECVDETQ